MINSHLIFYNNVYNDMKHEHSKYLLNNWPFNTDPKKHIYEEMAIAAYLMSLWRIDDCETCQPNNKELPNKDQSKYFQYKFLDLGCGNGLLTYFLTKCGFKGVGIDIRERKTWSILKQTEENLNLQEMALDPSQENCVFSEYEWIVGNHCDELTPWIPHLSQKNDTLHLPRNKLFILPCCPHDFYGKYQRRRPHLSRYEDYLMFLTDLLKNKYGFRTHVDKLRIPSTKRICLIGYPPSQKNTLLLKTSGDAIGTQTNFIPRPKLEVVRNCTLVDKSIITDIVNRVFAMIISADPIKGFYVIGCEKEKNIQDHIDKLKLSVEESTANLHTMNKIQHSNKEPEVVIEDSTIFWHCGGRVPLSDIIETLNSSEKTALKSQAGGIRTLLKNHGYIFTVKGEFVTLSYHANIDVGQNLNGNNVSGTSLGQNLKSRHKNRGNKKFAIFKKSKMCWFYQNHPQGCLYPESSCMYAHGPDNLIKL
ncbi:probable tRNA (uracil-O(2)-)-methyltransferase [Gordionus sp. m RMFG-2023]|uniref:probable tRNA (uracil-O(2)-)-methyltransferase n=1 Tax=Gordionus sp. m RMFG-2023 TaxID=3053472 RepID=UPI0031FBCB85